MGWCDDPREGGSKTGLSGALEDGGITTESGRDARHEEGVSAATLRDLHADAIRLKRGELPFVIAALVLGIVAAVAAAMAPGRLGFLGLTAGIVVFKTCVWLFEWIRLIRTDPFEHWRRESRDELDQKAAAAQIQARQTARKPVATLTLASLIALVTLAQFVLSDLGRSIAAAGLVKDAARGGEWWRLLTASYLHAGLWHVLGNVSALVAFGEIIEAYDRPLRVPLVYLAGVLCGGLFSLALLSAPSIGASAGVLALAGYLLVLLHRSSEEGTRWLRNRLVTAVAGTAILGVAGFFFIDNAAHAGGLLAGLALGVAAVPNDRTALSPSRALALEAGGWLAAAILAAVAAVTLSTLIP